MPKPTTRNACEDCSAYRTAIEALRITLEDDTVFGDTIEKYVDMIDRKWDHIVDAHSIGDEIL